MQVYDGQRLQKKKAGMNLITPAAIFSAVALNNTSIRNKKFLWDFVTFDIKQISIPVVD